MQIRTIQKLNSQSEGWISSGLSVQKKLSSSRLFRMAVYGNAKVRTESWMSSSKTPTETVDPVKEERAGKVREVGSQAIWSLSSCKPGFGVDQLRDDCMETYWQSDGQLPHLVNIQFRRKTTVSDICIFTDYKLDESYTPSRISIRAGTNFNDLQEVEVMDLNEPTGWVMIPIKDIHDQPIRTFMIQIAVISNHQNGRDTHMRQIKIHSPAEQHGAASLEGIGQFTSKEFRQYSCIR